MQYEFLFGGEMYTVELEKSGDLFKARVGDREYTIDACRASGSLISFIMNDRSVLAHMVRGESEWVLGVGGRQYVLEDPDAGGEAASDGAGGGGGSGLIQTPMPGKIVEVLVKEGDEVESGQALLIVESMKMQNEICADVNGVVRKIHFQAGDLANFGDPLVEIDVEEGE